MKKSSIEALEKRHPDLMFTDSELKSIHYVTGEDDRIGILVRRRGMPDQLLLMNLEQAYAVSKELKDVLFLVGRKKPDQKGGRGRPRKYAW